MHLSVFHSISNRASGKRSSVPAPYAFNSFFFPESKRLYDIQVTSFYIERVTAHRIKINDHSLKLKHIWEQGAPWYCGGPTQLVYSLYREDRLWVHHVMSLTQLYCDTHNTKVQKSSKVWDR